MNGFQIAIMVGAAVTAIVSWNLPRAFLWISFGTIVAIACDVAYAYKLPYPEAFTLACDALMCLVIHWFAKEKWEMGTFIIFQFSVLISLLRMGSFIDGKDTYRLALELCNWAALIMIAGTAIIGGAGGRVLHDHWVSYIRRAYLYLRSPPKSDHWRFR